MQEGAGGVERTRSVRKSFCPPRRRAVLRRERIYLPDFACCVRTASKEGAENSLAAVGTVPEEMLRLVGRTGSLSTRFCLW